MIKKYLYLFLLVIIIVALIYFIGLDFSNNIPADAIKI